MFKIATLKNLVLVGPQAQTLARPVVAIASYSFLQCASHLLNMPSSMDFEKVEYKTIDGIIIRGCLYAGQGLAPIIVMTPGVSGMNSGML